MTKTEFDSWRSDNCVNLLTEDYNGIEYKLCELKDGWIAVIEFNPYTQEFVPCVEAKDVEHARSYCCRRARLDFAARSLNREIREA